MLQRREFVGGGLAALASGGQSAAPTRRLLGITVMPEYIQSEGVDGVLQRLERAGANAVCTSPYVMEPRMKAQDRGNRPTTRAPGAFDCSTGRCGANANCS